MKSFNEFLNENRNKRYIVFLPLEKGVDAKDILIDNPAFGVYTEFEYEVSHKPYTKFDNFTTSIVFDNMKDAKKYKDLVVKAKGDMDSKDYDKVIKFERSKKK